MAAQQLKRLVRPIPPAELARMEREAELALQHLAADYLAVTCGQIEDLTGWFRDPHWDRADWGERVYRTAHDLKGQGSTFDYDLASRIGGSLCLLIQAREGLPASEFTKRALAHCQAARAVLDKQIKGDGGPDGAALLALLGTARA